jgi:hypothetical protein
LIEEIAVAAARQSNPVMPQLSPSKPRRDV